ncbi:histidine phosphatase superfamily [Syncephalastrum racemosum]|uniref:Histidine phosphatase superfamily n=1 Tax=Syncephalastrum racemosum TaxID=13706 RepID=A0A1X2HMZ9_SYNRA|nr:histidine phosphatase superfamily [Syncephalastrum racemosum]
MSPLTITLVRHGNTDANNERWLQGQMDTLLNENGKNQAERVSERLSTTAFDIVYCSDLTRCKQTAEAILARQPSPVETVYRMGLRERGFGTLSGQPIGHLRAESLRQNVDVDKLVADCGGESSADFRLRVIQAYRDLKVDARRRGCQHVLVVTHGGPLRAIADAWINHNYYVDAIQLPVPSHGNTAVSQVTYKDKDGPGRIVCLNSTDHLAAPAEAPPSV